MTSCVTPWFRNFWTDIFASIGNFQEHPYCANRELAVVDCLEAYGVYNGTHKCRVLLNDFRECILKGKQEQRTKIMVLERERQINAGEIDEPYAKAPRIDSY